MSSLRRPGDPHARGKGSRRGLPGLVGGLALVVAGPVAAAPAASTSSKVIDRFVQVLPHRTGVAALAAPAATSPAASTTNQPAPASPSAPASAPASPTANAPRTQATPAAPASAPASPTTSGPTPPGTPSASAPVSPTTSGPASRSTPGTSASAPATPPTPGTSASTPVTPGTSASAPATPAASASAPATPAAPDPAGPTSTDATRPSAADAPGIATPASKPPRVDGPYIGGMIAAGGSFMRVNNFPTPDPLSGATASLRFGQAIYRWMTIGLAVTGSFGQRPAEPSQRLLQGAVLVDFGFLPVPRIPLSLHVGFGAGGGAMRQADRSARSGFGGAVFTGAVRYEIFPLAARKRPRRGGGFSLGPELGWLGFTPAAKGRPMSNTVYIGLFMGFYFGS